MYQATINKKYYRNKKKNQERQEKLSLARKMCAEGKTIYEIMEKTGLTEYEIVSELGIG